MKTTNTKRLLSFILCIVLIAAVALFTSGCSDSGNQEAISSVKSEESSEVKELGEGKTKFDFSVFDLDGNETKFIVKTDKKTVGEALQDVGLIEGEEGEYGLYVKEVNGIPESDGAYWMVYVNGEMSPVGISQIEVKSGEAYSLRLEKF